ncbi:MAG: RsmE family RNA methyltransferase [Erysipelotrichaceae bacterium]
MQQYFVKETLQIQTPFCFDAEQSHHLKNVLRSKVGTVVHVVDGMGTKYVCELQALFDFVEALPLEQVVFSSELPVQITLIQGLLKGERWDFVLQKASELGVHQIVPLQSKRCVVKVLGDNTAKKLARWNKITLEACEQSKRNAHCTVQEVIDLSQVKQYCSALNVVAYEDSDFAATSLAKQLHDHPEVTSITVVIGPEGGFDKSEIERLEAMGFAQVSLGKRILRAETAAMSAVDTIGFYYENKEWL